MAKLFAMVSAVFACIWVGVRADAGHRHGCCEPCHTVWQEREVVCYRPVTEVKWKDVEVRVCRPVCETVMVEQHCRVAKPVTEMKTYEVSHTVCKPVYETVERPFTEVSCRREVTQHTIHVDCGHYEPKTVTDHCGCCRTCMVWVPNVQEKVIECVRMVPECHTVMKPVQVCRLVPETVTRQVQVPVTHCEYEDVVRQVPVKRCRMEVTTEVRRVSYCETHMEEVRQRVKVPVCVPCK